MAPNTNGEAEVREPYDYYPSGMDANGQCYPSDGSQAECPVCLCQMHRCEVAACIADHVRAGITTREEWIRQHPTREAGRCESRT